MIMHDCDELDIHDVAIYGRYHCPLYKSYIHVHIACYDTCTCSMLCIVIYMYI